MASTNNHNNRRKTAKSTSTNTTTTTGGEVAIQKSPAEFFAEHQSIAGFDNYGKSLYTTIRELVENSLDACEAIHELPTISIDIVEYTQAQLNNLTSYNDVRIDIIGSSNDRKRSRTEIRQPEPVQQIDTQLFQKKGRNAATKVVAGAAADDHDDNGPKSEDVKNEEHATTTQKDGTPNNSKKPSSSSKNKKETTTTAKQPHQYYMVTVTDNGCGMAHKAIPELLGRVLSGSKYGVRQTRGKFGLGAKMALIWAKKSTGQPIHILTAHRSSSTATSTTTSAEEHDEQQPPSTTTTATTIPPSKISSCILDIDIYNNQPRVLEHELLPNNTTNNSMVGTIVRVLIGGNWTTYKSRIIQYIQQLAIITPYAELSMTYTDQHHHQNHNHNNNISSSGKRDVALYYPRRSNAMPAIPPTVKHHPASVNNIIVQQLIQHTKTKNLASFLHKELSCVSLPIAKRIIAELLSSSSSSGGGGGTMEEDDDDEDDAATTITPSDLTDKQITRLVQLFHQVQLFRPPDGSCLRPLGEYNLSLGIQQVIQPDLIATTRDKVSAYEGHPFVIEAAVCLGSSNNNMKEGINVHRFANRIPLLFESGADVATRVATTKIKWSNYKIDYKRDKIGVFISIVSTKIPFKGTSKEYIGDDATEIHQSVKRAIQSCCQQLRTHLIKRNAMKDAKTRKSKLTKYIPDISRSLFGLLDGMRKRKEEAVAESSSSREGGGAAHKRLRLDDTSANQMIQRLDQHDVTEATIHQSLTEAVEMSNPDLDGPLHNNTASGDRAKQRAAAVPLYIVPLYNLDDPTHDVVTPFFTFRPIVPLQRIEPGVTTTTT